MANKNARQQLIDLLDKQAFNPVLNASPDQYQSEAKKKELKDVQNTTASTMHRYHQDYNTAQDVYTNYQSDLSSEAAQRVERELHDLNLPTLKDIEPQFEQLAHKLGVS